MDSLQTKIKEVIDSSMIYTPEQVKELNKDLDSTTQQNEYMTALGYQDALLDVHSSIPKIIEIVREESQKDRWESKCKSCGTHPSFWKTIVQSDEWRRWRVEQNQRMNDFPSEKSMYDMDECTELGIISENHWKDFIKFIKKMK